MVPVRGHCLVDLRPGGARPACHPAPGRLMSGRLPHLVEHMVFKGAGPRDARAIAEAIEDVGGTLNAWTARDQTAFHARILPGDLALAIELIGDLVRAPALGAGELERE